MFDWLVAQIDPNSGAALRRNVNRILNDHTDNIGHYLLSLTQVRVAVNNALMSYLPPHPAQVNSPIPSDDVYLLEQTAGFLQDQERNQLHVARLLRRISRD